MTTISVRVGQRLRVLTPGIALLGAATVLSPYLWHSIWRDTGFALAYVPFHLWCWVPFLILAFAAQRLGRLGGAAFCAALMAGTVATVELTQAIDGNSERLGLALPGLLSLAVVGAWGLRAHPRGGGNVSRPLAIAVARTAGARDHRWARRRSRRGRPDADVPGHRDVDRARGAAVRAARRRRVRGDRGLRPRALVRADRAAPAAVADPGRGAVRRGDAGVRVRLGAGRTPPDRARRASRRRHRVHARRAGDQPDRAVLDRRRLLRARRDRDGARPAQPRPRPGDHRRHDHRPPRRRQPRRPRQEVRAQARA